MQTCLVLLQAMTVYVASSMAKLTTSAQPSAVSHRTRKAVPSVRAVQPAGQAAADVLGQVQGIVAGVLGRSVEPDQPLMEVSNVLQSNLATQDASVLSCE